MSVTLLPASDVITEVGSKLKGLPVFIAGSAPAARAYTPLVDPTSYGDLDVFCGSANSLISAGTTLMHQGYSPSPRFERVWARWMKYGFNKWHTNSMKLLDDVTGEEVNLVYKLVDGHPTTSLAQVIESFDFGLLHTGYDCEEQVHRNLGGYLFPGQDLLGPLPMMPKRRESWRAGFISQYQGLRQVGRYVKYLEYGYDMSLIKDDMQEGYFAISSYMLGRTDDPDKLLLGEIYETLALHVQHDEIGKLKSAGSEILFLDNLDSIMAALE